MASPKALSPVNIHGFASSPHARLSITSPRVGSVSNRPSSPLSPRSDSSFRAMDTMDITSPAPPRSRAMQSQLSQQLNQNSQQQQQQQQKQQQQRRRLDANLQLPALPRFHPAKYPSACSSLSGTPRSDQNTPTGPVSPGLQERVRAEAQRSRYQYQREVLHGFVARASLGEPGSVHLAPLGSPGLPMTPLTLDEPADGYIKMDTEGRTNTSSPDELRSPEETPSA